MKGQVLSLSIFLMHHFYFPRVDSCNIISLDKPYVNLDRFRVIYTTCSPALLQLSAEGNSHNWEYIAVTLCTETIGKDPLKVE